MNPKKAHQIFYEHAQKNNLDTDLVADLLGFYWLTLRKKMSNLEAPIFRIRNFGDFRITYKKLVAVKLKNEEYLKKLAAVEKSSFTRYDEVSRRLERIRRVKAIMEDQYERKKQFFYSKKLGTGTDSAIPEAE